MKKRRYATHAAVAGMVALMAWATPAAAYSTKVHMITGYDIARRLKRDGCKLKLEDWGNPAPVGDYLRQKGASHKSKTITLRRDICNLITSAQTMPYFLSGTTGPDTFPGMFGNTDPTHALHWNTPWQTAVLWQNARTAAEKAFVLGWLVHFAGDLNAHGLANLHAQGVWMEGGRSSTVWKHIVTETYYAMKLLPYPRLGGKRFPNTLKWPKSFVMKMFFNPSSPIYRHYDYLWNKRPAELGAVAKAFGTAYRTMFLLWDYHAKEMNRWNGHRDYYSGRRDRTVSDYLHWMFADQAAHFHSKRVELAKNIIDRWYEGTHRAQQAIVADKHGTFTGRGFYPGYVTRFGKKYRRKNMYRKGSISGVLGAYKYLKEAVTDYAFASPITITDKNAPRLRRFLDRFKSVGQKVYETIKRPLEAMKAAITKVTDAFKNALLAVLAPVINKAKHYISERAPCALPGMGKMCRSITAQGRAFGVKAGNLDTYMGWPVYRNTITTAALMLERIGRMPKGSGDETMSPLFGLPSGDFGCTASCTKVQQDNWRLFMPMAGKYYSARSGANRAMPDYCMVGSDTRRRLSINERYVPSARGTNHQANNGFTCFARTRRCRGVDVYKGRAKLYQPTGRFGRYAARFFRTIAGRWTALTHVARRSGRVVNSAGTTKRGSRSVRFCYKALAYNRATVAPGVSDPARDRYNRRYYKRKGYSLLEMTGQASWARPLLNMLGKRFSQALDLAQRTWGKVRDTANKVKEKVSDTTAAARRKARELAAAAKRKADELKRKAADLAAAAKRKTDAARRKAAELAAAAKRKADELAAAARRKADEAKRRARELAAAAKRRFDAAVSRAKSWASSAVSSLSGAFSRAYDSAKGFFSDVVHKTHRDCLGHVSDFGKQAGRKVKGEAESRAYAFFSHLSSALSGMSSSDKRRAVDSAWRSLLSAINSQIWRVRSAGISKVRGWATWDSTKSKHESAFKSSYDSYSAVTSSLQSIFNSKTR